MGENKSVLVKGAMMFGLALGIYWIFKYIFFIWGFSLPVMSSVYWGFTCLVPFIAYRMTIQYKRMADGQISFFHAWQFGVLLYTFAALVVSLMHYIFYRYLAPPDFLANAFNQTIEMLKQSKVDPKMLDEIGEMHITPIQMVIQGIFSNIFYGVVFSLPVAIFAYRKRDDSPTPPYNSNSTDE